MPWRWYPKINKVTRADGTVARYKSRCKKWLKFHKPYKPQKRGLEKKSVYSSRFGFLDLYSRKEQQELKCPSGYTIGQCFNMMRNMWHGYHRARLDGEGIEKMVKYAKKIQEVQKDLGIPTSSFPHIGLYGDVLVLEDKKEKRLVFEDHSKLKKKQEEYEKWQAQQIADAKKIQETLHKPDKEKGEEIVTFADDVYPYEMYDNDEDEEIEIEAMPELLKPDKEKGEEIITMTDDVPFLDSDSSN
jgi:hypothetical protein